MSGVITSKRNECNIFSALPIRVWLYNYVVCNRLYCFHVQHTKLYATQGLLGLPLHMFAPLDPSL